MKTTVSEKGQITIPKVLRERLGLRSGVILDFREESGRLIGEKRVAEDPFGKWRGKGSLPEEVASTDEYLAQVRER